jgi:outer membrane protein assembly factor BamB
MKRWTILCLVITHCALAVEPGVVSLSFKHQEIRRFPAAEAHQGVAVDAHHFYAITNAAIGKYDKTTGERVGGWESAKDPDAVAIKHLNAGLILDGKLWCAHSNYPEVPMRSSVEVWDPIMMKHLESIDLTDAVGSLTWIDRRDGVWLACFAQYAKTGDPGRTRVIRFDAQWKKLANLTFPAEAVAKFGKNSSSGGIFGPGRHLYITGHDAQELYVLDLPVKGKVLTWRTSLPISAHGQAFAWDRSKPGQLYSIDRKTHEVIVSSVTTSKPDSSTANMSSP